MSFTMADLHGALRASGRDVSEGDAALAYVRIDQEALRSEHSQRVRWERWDGETPIGDARPIDIVSRLDYNGGEIYLVYVDERLVFLQPHGPDSQPIRQEDLAKVAGDHVRTIVDSLVFEVAIQEALRLLPGPVPGPVAPMVGGPGPATPLPRPPVNG